MIVSAAPNIFSPKVMRYSCVFFDDVTVLENRSDNNNISIIFRQAVNSLSINTDTSFMLVTWSIFYIIQMNTCAWQLTLTDEMSGRANNTFGRESHANDLHETDCMKHMGSLDPLQACGACASLRRDFFCLHNGRFANLEVAAQIPYCSSPGESSSLCKGSH